MKTHLILLILTFGFIIISGMIKTTNAKTETQKYETLYKKDNFEIRYYPEAILASVTMNGSFDDSRNSGFRILAAYIFGGNKEEQNIAMTSPVRMNSNEKESTMSFVLPSKMDFDNLPEPISKQIVLHRSKPMFTASIRYGGYSNSKDVEKMETELKKILAELGLEFSSEFEFLGYNSPYQIVNRRNEVIVELNNFNKDTFEKNLANR